MYRARDQVENEEWLSELQQAADRLELDADARTFATDIFLSAVPDAERSKPAVVAASLYAGTLIAGDQRSQSTVADACDVSRLTIQSKWKTLLEEAGLDPPGW